MRYAAIVAAALVASTILFDLPSMLSADNLLVQAQAFEKGKARAKKKGKRKRKKSQSKAECFNRCIANGKTAKGCAKRCQ